MLVVYSFLHRLWVFGAGGAFSNTRSYEDRRASPAVAGQNASTHGADDEQVLAVNDAMVKFALVEPKKAALVKLRLFAGLTIEEPSQTLGVSEPTAKRWWVYARAWLFREMHP